MKRPASWPSSSPLADRHPGGEVAAGDPFGAGGQRREVAGHPPGERQDAEERQADQPQAVGEVAPGGALDLGQGLADRPHDAEADAALGVAGVDDHRLVADPRALEVEAVQGLAVGLVGDEQPALGVEGVGDLALAAAGETQDPVQQRLGADPGLDLADQPAFLAHRYVETAGEETGRPAFRGPAFRRPAFRRPPPLGPLLGALALQSPALLLSCPGLELGLEAGDLGVARRGAGLRGGALCLTRRQPFHPFRDRLGESGGELQAVAHPLRGAGAGILEPQLELALLEKILGHRQDDRLELGLVDLRDRGRPGLDDLRHVGYRRRPVGCGG